MAEQRKSSKSCLLFAVFCLNVLAPLSAADDSMSMSVACSPSTGSGDKPVSTSAPPASSTIYDLTTSATLGSQESAETIPTLASPASANSPPGSQSTGSSCLPLQCSTPASNSNTGVLALFIVLTIFFAMTTILASVFARNYRRQLSRKHDCEMAVSLEAGRRTTPMTSASTCEMIPLPGNATSSSSVECTLTAPPSSLDFADESDYADPIAAASNRVELQKSKNSIAEQADESKPLPDTPEPATRRSEEEDGYNIPFETLTAIRHHSVRRKRNSLDKDKEKEATTPDHYAEIDAVLAADQSKPNDTGREDCRSLSMSSFASRSRDHSPRASVSDTGPRRPSSNSLADVHTKNNRLAPPSPIYAMIDMSRKSYHGSALQAEELLQTDM